MKTNNIQAIAMKDGAYVYILCNKPNGCLYIGVTTDLVARVWQHKSRIGSQFCKKYNIDRLVYYERHYLYKDAIMREKHLKKYYRQWKINLIEQNNPEWNDLYPEIANPLLRG